MADDTRQSREDLSREALTVNPENKPFAGTQWQGGKQVPYKAPDNANVLAGGTEHTAGGHTPDVTVGNAFQNGLKWDDFVNLPKRPCVRDALLTGIGSGAALGGFRTIIKGSVWTSCSWAVGSFCFSAAGMYQYCLYKRQAEKEGMMRAVEILNKKDVEKKAREQRKERAREERRLAKEEELEGRFAAAGAVGAPGGRVDGAVGKSWYRFW